MIVFSILLSCLGAGAAFLFFRVLTRDGSGTQSEERVQLEKDIAQVGARLSSLLESTGKVYSQGQLDSISQQLCDKAIQIEKESERLHELEKTLESLQNNVEIRESKHQEMKSAREEDEIAVEEFLERYPLISDEAISLEQQIAQHMKQIDKTVEDLSSADESRPALVQIQEALQMAGAAMRAELMEYQSTKERLDGLKGQHHDLEDEYTKLVEQQLGG